MPASAIEQKALSLLRTFENAGKSVSRITIEGKKIELVLATEQTPDEYAGIDMRYHSSKQQTLVTCTQVRLIRTENGIWFCRSAKPL